VRIQIDCSHADTHIESDDFRRVLLDRNAVAMLITNLGDSDWFVRGSAGEALAQLAKHGTQSDLGAMRTLI
jgi:hypothetical protein